jgi:hypothetical protein
MYTSLHMDIDLFTSEGKGVISDAVRYVDISRGGRALAPET